MVKKNESATPENDSQISGPELLAQTMKEIVQIGNLVVSIETTEKVTELIQQSTALIENGKLEKALQLLEEAQEMCEYALPDNHPTTLPVIRLRVRVLILQERYAQAELFLRRNINTLRKEQGTIPSDLAESLYLMFLIKKETEKHNDAEIILEECISLFETDHTTDSDTIVSLLVALFNTQLDLEKFKDANSTLHKALKIREQEDAEHPDIEKIKALIQGLQDLL